MNIFDRQEFAERFGYKCSLDYAYFLKACQPFLASYHHSQYQLLKFAGDLNSHALGYAFSS